MNTHKIAFAAAALSIGAGLFAGPPAMATTTQAVAVVTHEHTQSSRPLPPKCNPNYMTTPGECPVLY